MPSPDEYESPVDSQVMVLEGAAAGVAERSMGADALEIASGAAVNSTAPVRATAAARRAWKLPHRVLEPPKAVLEPPNRGLELTERVVMRLLPGCRLATHTHPVRASTSPGPAPTTAPRARRHTAPRHARSCRANAAGRWGRRRSAPAR